MINEFSNQTENTTQRLEKFLPLLFPEQWRIDNPNLIQELPRSTEISPIKTLDLQMQAISSWEGTCNRLKNITNPTMVLVGTDDVITVPENSMLMASKMTGSWLIQIGGHAVGCSIQRNLVVSLMYSSLRKREITLLIIQKLYFVSKNCIS